MVNGYLELQVQKHYHFTRELRSPEAPLYVCLDFVDLRASKRPNLCPDIVDLGLAAGVCT